MEIRYINSKNIYGNMNTNKNFYPKDLTEEEIQEEFLKHRLSFGNDYGFDGHKMYMASQNDSKNYLKGNGGEIGSYFELSEDYVKKNPNGWSDIDEDILIITDKAPEIVGGHPVSDYPVVIISDIKKHITAIAHCSAELIDAHMPMMIADSLTRFANSEDKNLFAYVSACAGPNWTYKNIPQWVKDFDIWEEAITKDGELYKIDLRKAIKKQLALRNLQENQVYYDLTDTITTEDYYSDFVASPYGLNNPSKAGHQFIGAFYKGKTLTKKR